MIRTPSASQLKKNLAELSSNLETYGGGLSASSSSSAKASRLSGDLYLSNASSHAAFAKICESGALLPITRPGKPPPPFGTDNSIFFYVAPFRFPKTDCGLLFARTLEESEPEGVASPFDSGGLANVFQLPDPSESKLSFLIRHELPSPDHRSYLKRRMELLFKTPEGYVEGDDLDRACCIGLTGGDIRRWTHEVRIPDRVELRNRHLAAVFVSSLARSTGVETFLKWCLRNNIDVISLPASRAGGFEELKKASILYIQRTLY